MPYLPPNIVVISSTGEATVVSSDQLRSLRRPRQIEGVTPLVSHEKLPEPFMIDVTPRGSGPSGAPALPRGLS